MVITADTWALVNGPSYILRRERRGDRGQEVKRELEAESQVHRFALYALATLERLESGPSEK